MPEVLSQSQIDALLNSMNSGGGGASPAEEEPQEKKYRKYDFSSPRKFTKDRLKMISDDSMGCGYKGKRSGNHLSPYRKIHYLYCQF